MAIEITMPRLSDTMEEGTLVKWRISVGDSVSSGDVLADIETDKATMELQAYDDGVVAKLVVGEGESLPVGALIALLAEKDESLDETLGDVTGDPGPPTQETTRVASGQPAQAPAGPGVATPMSPGGRLRVSPVARKLAAELHVDLTRVAGTGPDGRVIKRDVLNNAAPGAATITEARATAPERRAATTLALTGMRKTIARRLVESKNTIPHFTVTMAVSMDRLIEQRQSLNTVLASKLVKLSVNDFVVRATALALLGHPNLNASWSDDAITIHPTVNIGIAVALPPERGGGLVVPTIRDAQHKSVQQISTETRALATAARSQGLSIEQMSDGTFTISNLGMLGVDHFEAIINPPQAAILAVGAALQKPVVQNGQLTVGHEMDCTVSCDHRIVDGVMAAEFLQSLKQQLENPAVLLLDA